MQSDDDDFRSGECDMPSPHWTVSIRTRFEAQALIGLTRAASPLNHFEPGTGGAAFAISLGVAPALGVYDITDILAAVMALLDAKAA